MGAPPPGPGCATWPAPPHPRHHRAQECTVPISHTGPLAATQAPCAAWSGPPARSRELGRAGPPQHGGGPVSPAPSATWPENCLVASAAAGQRLARSRGLQEEVASPATVGTRQAGWEVAATCSGGWSCWPPSGCRPPRRARHRPRRSRRVTAHCCWTGAFIVAAPRTRARPAQPLPPGPCPEATPGGRGQRGLLAGSQGWAVRPVQRRPLLVPWRGLRRGSQPARGGHRPRGLPRRGPGRPRGCPHPAPAAASRAGRRARGR